MARKGQFKKGGGRHGGATHTKSRKSHSHAMTHSPRVITKTRTRTVVKRAKRRHGRHGGGGMKLTHLALTAAGLAFLTGPKSPVSQIKDIADKIPGTKTFGAPAMIGIACLAVDRFVKPNKWLKLLGVAGVVLAAVKIGTDGTDFKFVGDNEGSTGDFDLADGEMGDEDVGDDMGDVEGDDMGDVEGDDD